MSKAKKESFFWTSFSDLMTSLFFVMLLLFVLTMGLLHKKITVQNVELETKRKIEQIEEALKNIDPNLFEYKEEYQKHVLKFDVWFPRPGLSNINTIRNVTETKDKLLYAGRAIKSFIEKTRQEHKDLQYLLIIEGQASKDGYWENYELSYKRALALYNFWKEKGIIFDEQYCEVLISGSGEGGSMREPREREEYNQRFLIHIIPKIGNIGK